MKLCIMEYSRKSCKWCGETNEVKIMPSYRNIDGMVGKEITCVHCMHKKAIK
jgi:hypothetical protein